MCGCSPTIIKVGDGRWCVTSLRCERRRLDLFLRGSRGSRGPQGHVVFLHDVRCAQFPSCLKGKARHVLRISDFWQNCGPTQKAAKSKLDRKSKGGHQLHSLSSPPLCVTGGGKTQISLHAHTLDRPALPINWSGNIFFTFLFMLMPSATRINNLVGWGQLKIFLESRCFSRFFTLNFMYLLIIRHTSSSPVIPED